MKAFITTIIYIVISIPIIIYLVVDGTKKQKITNQTFEEMKGKIGSLVREMNVRGYEQAKAI
jgi:membrane-bound ClpP family serine protease